MVCHGQCASSPAFQQPANFNVALVKKTEMVRHGQAMCKQRSFSAAGQFQCCASQEDRDGESSTLKFWIAGSDARSSQEDRDGESSTLKFWIAGSDAGGHGKSSGHGKSRLSTRLWEGSEGPMTSRLQLSWQSI